MGNDQDSGHVAIIGSCQLDEGSALQGPHGGGSRRRSVSTASRARRADRRRLVHANAVTKNAACGETGRPSGQPPLHMAAARSPGSASRPAERTLGAAGRRRRGWRRARLQRGQEQASTRAGSAPSTHGEREASRLPRRRSRSSHPQRRCTDAARVRSCSSRRHGKSAQSRRCPRAATSRQSSAGEQATSAAGRHRIARARRAPAGCEAHRIDYPDAPAQDRRAHNLPMVDARDASAPPAGQRRTGARRRARARPVARARRPLVHARRSPTSAPT